ncbi:MULTISPECIES: hypothetical protein [unclassified Marinovum]
MSLFDYPRIHFSGACTLNPGTANNDDYSGGAIWPPTGENLALIDSATVMPRTFGMTDDAFRAWIQKPQTFDSAHAPNNADPGDAADCTKAKAATKTTEIVPAEWNYYGDMQMDVSAPITGVQVDPATAPDPAVQSALEALNGQSLSFAGNITDVNSEGSPPGTQFFINAPTFAIGANTLGGTPTKAACQWINFLRNVNLVADGGAGGYMYHVIEGAQKGLPGFDAPGVTGIVLRYYLFARHGGLSKNADIAKLYESGGINPAELQITGTIAPYYGNETARTGPVGHLLTADVPNISVPAEYHNNLSQPSGPTEIALAPAVVSVAGQRVSIDAIGSFPECANSGVTNPWSDPTKFNPKFDFGPVALQVASSAGNTATLGEIDYADTAGGNAKGWIFDFDVSDNAAAAEILEDSEAQFSLVHPAYGPVLSESEYYVLTNMQAIYGEQGGSTTAFRNQGAALEAVSFDVLRYGAPVGAGGAPMQVWAYRTTPLGYSSNRVKLGGNYVPGAPLTIPVDQSGTFLLTLQIGDEAPPPETYGPNPGTYIGPNFTILTNRTAISLRVLPNEDFSAYLTGPAEAPVGNDALTFDVVYAHVLRTYDLLFPSMNKHFHLSDEAAVMSNAGSILARTDPNIWNTPQYMPITRDLSDSRRTLLQAWCRKALAS